jgi:hypothetical protein
MNQYQFYGFCAGLLGLAVGMTGGLAVAWKLQIDHGREIAELAADLNAYRTMAEWAKLEEAAP